MNIWWALAFCVVVIVGPFATLRQISRYREARRAREQPVTAPSEATPARRDEPPGDEGGPRDR